MVLPTAADPAGHSPGCITVDLQDEGAMCHPEVLSRLVGHILGAGGTPWCPRCPPGELSPLLPGPVSGACVKTEAVKLCGECKGGETALERAHLGIAILPASPTATVNICCIPRSCQHMLSAALFPVPKPSRPAIWLEC